MSTDFDTYAKTYAAVHNDNLAPFGAESREFLHAKLKWCAQLASAHFKPSNLTKTFLDYGCGTGRFGHEFHTYFDKSWDYVGVDPSLACLNEAKEQYASIGQHISQVTKSPLFLDLNTWKSGAMKYDFILAACVFHHIEPAQRVFVLRKLWDLLGPNGVILIWEHNPWNPITRKIVKDCPFDRDARLLSLREIINLWRRTINSGETNYRFVTFFPGALRKLQPIERVLGWLPLGGQWVFWGNKGE